MRKRGFTLIELLIVIAIIAILALIAIPNFIEAQTRAKIARVMGDQRTVATAMEAYAVDWSRYPHYMNMMDGNDDPDVSCTASDMASQVLTYVPTNLTTPNGYMTSVLVDPYRHVAVTNDPQRPFRYRHAIVEDAGGRYDYDFLVYNDHNDSRGGGDQIDGFYHVVRDYKQMAGNDLPGIQWFLHCPGPDLLATELEHRLITVYVYPAGPAEKDRVVRYDPTNGTITGGDIMRLGP